MSKFKTNEEYFEFSKRLVVIPTEEIKELLLKHKIKLPYFVHTFLLKETIREKVFEDKIYNTYTDEQKFRLRGYDNYSIFPLEKMIEAYNLDFELARYKELLFDFLFINQDQFNIKGNFFKELELLQHNYTVDLEVMRYSDFYELFKVVMYTENGYLDGLRIKEYTDDVLASYTLGDLKGLGKKYDVSVPRRINKSKLIEILKAKFKLTDDEVELISKKSVLDLEIYAKEKGFKISIDLKKRDMIEYIEFSLGMYHKPVHIDTFDYGIPLQTIEEVALGDLEDEVQEDIIEEPLEVTVPIEEEVEEISLEDTLVEDILEEPIQEEIHEEVQAEPVELEQTEEIIEPIQEEIHEEEVEEVIEKPVLHEEKIIKEESLPKPMKEEPKIDESLLSNEEKELLDEKINQIIKKYYKKRRRRRITWAIIITLIVAIVVFLGYSYFYYLNYDVLPFGINIPWL